MPFAMARRLVEAYRNGARAEAFSLGSNSHSDQLTPLSLTQSEAAVDEQRIHEAFEVGIWLKGAHALLECVGGLILALVSAQTIGTLINRVTQDDFIEDHHDRLATFLQHMAQGFSVKSEHFYAFYLLSHGVVKLFLVGGLIRSKLWAYPASLVLMGLFIGYQLYRYSYTHGFGLILLTLFDLIVIGLVWHEYRLVRRHLPAK